MPSISRWAALAVLPLATVAVSAAPASATSPSLAKAQALVATAISATSSATSVTVNGAGSSSGQKVKINLSVGANDAFGTLSYSGQTTTLRRVGAAIYAKGTQGFLEQQGLSTSQAKVEANKWFSIPSSDATDYHDLDQFLTVSGLLSGLVPTAKNDVVTAEKTSTLHGQAVDVISGTFSGQKGSLYVAAHGKPYLLQVVQLTSSAGGGTIDLSNYNKSVKTTAPKGAVAQ